MLKGNRYNQDKLVKEDFGLRVKEQLTSIEARVLPPPPVISLFYLYFFYCFRLFVFVTLKTSMGSA